ncbi:MAG: hypothetical protein L6Q92_08695 [Phycisphaerae bacterium]|nr:hypothetical protein [Phycisphaerae bacterium]
MPEYSDYQKKIIERYYENLDSIALTRLQELAGELYLADTEKKRERLWQRVAQAMRRLKVKPALMEHILTRRDPAVLAANVNDWVKAAGRP